MPALGDRVVAAGRSGSSGLARIPREEPSDPEFGAQIAHNRSNVRVPQPSANGAPSTRAGYQPLPQLSSAPVSRRSASLPPASLPPASLPQLSSPPVSRRSPSLPPASLPPASPPPVSRRSASLPPASLPPLAFAERGPATLVSNHHVSAPPRRSSVVPASAYAAREAAAQSDVLYNSLEVPTLQRDPEAMRARDRHANVDNEERSTGEYGANQPVMDDYSFAHSVTSVYEGEATTTRRALTDEEARMASPAPRAYVDERPQQRPFVAAEVDTGQDADIGQDADPTGMHMRGAAAEPAARSHSMLDTLSTASVATDGLTEERHAVVNADAVLQAEQPQSGPPRVRAPAYAAAEESSTNLVQRPAMFAAGVSVTHLANALYEDDEEEPTRVGQPQLESAAQRPASHSVDYSVQSAHKMSSTGPIAAVMHSEPPPRRGHDARLEADGKLDGSVAGAPPQATPPPPRRAGNTAAAGQNKYAPSDPRIVAALASDQAPLSEPTRAQPLASSPAIAQAPFGALRVPVAAISANLLQGGVGPAGGGAAGTAQTPQSHAQPEHHEDNRSTRSPSAFPQPTFPPVGYAAPRAGVVTGYPPAPSHSAPHPSAAGATMGNGYGVTAAAIVAPVGVGPRAVAAPKSRSGILWVAFAVVVGGGLPLGILTLRDRMQNAPDESSGIRPTATAASATGASAAGASATARAATAQPVATSAPSVAPLPLPLAAQAPVVAQTSIATNARPSPPSAVPVASPVAVRTPPAPVAARPPRPRPQVAPPPLVMNPGPSAPPNGPAIAANPPNAGAPVSEPHVEMSPKKPPAAAGILDDAL